EDLRAPDGLPLAAAAHGHDQLGPGLGPDLAVDHEAVGLLERLDGRVGLGPEDAVGRDAGAVVAQQVLQRLDRPAPPRVGRHRPRGQGCLAHGFLLPQPANMPLTRACQVTGPTMPSTVIPTPSWKPRTKASVFGPKIPSIASDGGLPLRSRNAASSCTPLTASPWLPRRTVTM